MRDKKFMVIRFTLVAFVAVIAIVLFGFKGNKVETPTKCNVITTPIMTTINIKGNEYKINENDPVDRDYENGQKLYKAEDGTYIGWVAVDYWEYESYGRDTNGDSYSTGTQMAYNYKWEVVSEDWDVHTIEHNDINNILADNK